MASGRCRRPVHPVTGSHNEAPEPTDGKRRLIQGEGSVARISYDYRLQLLVVVKDIPGSAVPCHVGTAQSLYTASIRLGSVRRAVRHSYSDSEESDNDVAGAVEHDNTVQQVSLHHNRLTPTAVDSCGARCAQLDDFNWFLPADDWSGDLPTPGSTKVRPSILSQIRPSPWPGPPMFA